MTEQDRTARLAEPGPPVLEGERVVLRALRDSDVPRIVEACGDPLTQQWLGRMPSPFADSDAVAWLAECRETDAAGTTITWAVADPETGAMVGAINLFDIERGRRAEVGYWSHPVARGRGLMAEASRLAVEHGFGVLGVTRVTGHAAVGNTASQKVLEASGLRQVDVVPDGTTIHSGVADALLFARDAREVGSSD